MKDLNFYYVASKGIKELFYNKLIKEKIINEKLYKTIRSTKIMYE